MRPTIVIAVVLIAVGIAALTYQGITYTSRNKAVDIGPIQVTTERERTIPVPPIVGVLALVGGVVLLVVTVKKKKHEE